MNIAASNAYGVLIYKMRQNLFIGIKRNMSMFTNMDRM